MIHRAILGSVERFMAILTEHVGGKWPFFISPRQIAICPITDKSADYAKQVYDKLHKAGFEVELDYTKKPLPKKIFKNQKL
jgi:threonyl-tRNA synthetase